MWLLRVWVTAILAGAVLADMGWTPVKRRKPQVTNSKQNDVYSRQVPTVRLTVPEYVLIVPRISDKELQQESSNLIKSDVNNMAENVEIIFENDNSNVIKRFRVKEGVQLDKKPTFKALNDLFRLYNGNMDSSRVDPLLREKLENSFLQEIIKTSVIQNLFKLLAKTNKNLSTMPQQRELLKKIWFTTFSRAGYKSSAFAHIFRGEKQVNGISGLHNWYFILEYLKKGQLKASERHSFSYVNPSTKKVMLDLKSWYLTYDGLSKPSSVLFGVSPELEIALATVCFIYRTKQPCTLALGDHPLEVQVFPWDIRHQDILVISTYYPTLNPRFNTASKDMAPFQKRRRRQSIGSIPRRIPIRARG